MKKLFARLFNGETRRSELLAEADAALDSGNLSAALAGYDRLLAASPRDGLVLAHKSAGLLRSDRIDEALRCAEAATSVAPGLVAAWLERARALLKKGELDEAFEACSKTLELMPANAQGNSLMGVIQLSRGDPVAAERCLAEATRLNPRNADILFNHGNALCAAGRPAEAKDRYLNALRYAPDDAAIYSNLGNAFLAMGDIDEALGAYDKALELDQDFLPALTSKAMLFEQTNRLDDAEQALSLALELESDNPANQLTMAILKRRMGDFDSALERLRSLDASRLPDASLETEYHFETGRVLDRLGQPDAAFTAFAEGNRKQVEAWRSRGIDKREYLAVIDHCMKVVNRDWAGSWPPVAAGGPGGSADSPAFMVGFPRSGTTLLNQVLSGHPRVLAIEELSVVPQLAAAINEKTGRYPEALAEFRDVAVQSLRDNFFELTARVVAEPLSGRILIDKLPLNIVHLALIHRLFPDARIIMAVRHPCDAVLSCFMQKFALNNAMANFSSVADAAVLYDKVMSLFRQYQESLPLQIHYLHYERLLGDLEGEARGLTSFLGLDWSPDMLNYQRTALDKRLINTPSYAAVSENIYRHAAGRWKRYGGQLSAVKDLLNPWVDHFGYRERI